PGEWLLMPLAPRGAVLPNGGRQVVGEDLAGELGQRLLAGGEHRSSPLGGPVGAAWCSTCSRTAAVRNSRTTSTRTHLVDQSDSATQHFIAIRYRQTI
ncbi:MAG: hypothetical protein WCF33_06910, partial [Pseudonocardiaceae bacterium]